MQGISRIFMVLGAFTALAGMAWGISMSASNDHTLSPAHAHLNLLGWVNFAIFAIYYHLVPAAAASVLARVHLVTAILGVALLIPGIVLAINNVTEGLAAAGSIVSIVSMAVFTWVVLSTR